MVYGNIKKRSREKKKERAQRTLKIKQRKIRQSILRPVINLRFESRTK